MVRHIGTAISHVFIYLFSVQIRNQHLPKPKFKNPPSVPSEPRYVGSNPSESKKYNENMKFLKSVFFLILCIVKYYLYFCNGYLEVQNLFSV